MKAINSRMRALPLSRSIRIMDKRGVEYWFQYIVKGMMHDAIPVGSGADYTPFRFIDRKVWIMNNYR